MGARGLPLSLQTVADHASELAGGPLGISGPNDSSGATQTFTLLGDIIEQYHIKRENIFNMDEKGIQLGIGDKIKVLVDRDQKAVQKIESGNRDLVTIVECVYADGTALHPSIVFEGQRRDLCWGKNNPSNASISISPNGWTDQELGYLWLEKDFAPETALRASKTIALLFSNLVFLYLTMGMKKAVRLAVADIKLVESAWEGPVGM